MPSKIKVKVLFSVVKRLNRHKIVRVELKSMSCIPPAPNQIYKHKVVTALFQMLISKLPKSD